MKQIEIVQTIVTLEQPPYLFNYFLAKVLIIQKWYYNISSPFGICRSYGAKEMWQY